MGCFKLLFIGLFFLSTESFCGSVNRPLYKQYPILNQKLPCKEFAQLPTPIAKMEALGRELGLDQFYIKDDGKSAERFGGNKVRKLEFAFGDAQSKGCRSVLTIGAAGSNHAAATAAHAQENGFDCFLFLTPQQMTSNVKRNLPLMQVFGAEIKYYKTRPKRDEDIEKMQKKEIEEYGAPLYFIPGGASDGVGSIGFVNAIFELKSQIEQGVMPKPDVIYVPGGSFGTAAGLLLGCKLANLDTLIMVIQVRPDLSTMDCNEYIRQYFEEGCKLLHEKSLGEIPLVSFKDYDGYQLRKDFIGDGYTFISQKSGEAVKLVKSLEGLNLDTTYSGKCFAALIHDALQKKIQMFTDKENPVVLFWNTFFGDPANDLVAQADIEKIPEDIRSYLTMDLQEFDIPIA